MLALLAVLVIPLIETLPLGTNRRTAILAWLLVALAFYWLYCGAGYWPLLMLQLLTFSCAATLLTAKVALLVFDVHRLAVLRHLAKVLILVGAVCAIANLGRMFWALFRWRRQLRHLHEPSPVRWKA